MPPIGYDSDDDTNEEESSPWHAIASAPTLLLLAALLLTGGIVVGFLFPELLPFETHEQSLDADAKLEAEVQVTETQLHALTDRMNLFETRQNWNHDQIIRLDALLNNTGKSYNDPSDPPPQKYKP